MRNPAHCLENLAPREDRLVAVGQTEPTGSDARAPLDQAESGRAFFKTQTKRPSDDRGIGQARLDRGGPAAGKPGIGVKEQERGSTRLSPPGLQLPGTTWLSFDHYGSACARDFGGAVAAPAVHDHHLDEARRGIGEGASDPVGVRLIGRIPSLLVHPAGPAGPAGALDHGRDLVRLVSGGDHHGDPHRAKIAPRRKAGLRLTCATPLPYPSPVSVPPKHPDDSTTAPAYARAGVDLDRDEAFVERIGAIARATFRPEVLSGIGGFAGLFKAPDRYREPVFVASADGVGTKLKLAAELKRFDTVGIDCVAMVVNDLAVQGAEPLVFLDYLAMSRLEPDRAEEALRGIAEGCRRAGCALLGGETASMPGVYADGELELVGFGVGVVERDGLIDGSTISEGDVLIGIASNGLHSNGYSLVRRILEDRARGGGLDLFAEEELLNGSLASALLTPTRIYCKAVLNLARHFEIKGLIHVTGGGLEGNVPRVLPRGVRARFDLGTWPRPAIFTWLERFGGLDESELLRVFNCGLGMIAVVPAGIAGEVIERLQGLGERAYPVGAIERRSEDEPPIHFARRRPE